MTTFIEKLGFILIRDRNMLVVRDHGKTVWLTPGGTREAGESDEQALIREVREELGVELAPETIAYYGTFEAQAHGKPEGTLVRITCYTGSFAGEPMPCSEIEELGWVNSSTQVPLSVTGELILDDLKAKGLVD